MWCVLQVSAHFCLLLQCETSKRDSREKYWLGGKRNEKRLGTCGAAPFTTQPGNPRNYEWHYASLRRIASVKKKSIIIVFSKATRCATFFLYHWNIFMLWSRTTYQYGMFGATDWGMLLCSMVFECTRLPLPNSSIFAQRTSANRRRVTWSFWTTWISDTDSG